MRKKPEPASVEDASDSGEAILHSKQTAARVGKASLSSRHNNNNHHHHHRFAEETVFGYSICKGPIKNAIEKYDGPRPLTIFSRSHDWRTERNEVKGHRFRKIFFTDEKDVLNSTSPRHQDHDKERDRNKESIKLTAFIPNKDETLPDPKLYVEQQTYNEDGQRVTVMQQLIFGGNIRVGVEYVFKECGDEEEEEEGKRGIRIERKKPDLHVRFCSLEQNIFDTYMQKAKYYGYDRDVDVCIKEDALYKGVSYPLSSPITGATSSDDSQQHSSSSSSSSSSTCSISLDGRQLQSLLAAKRHTTHDSPDTTEVIELIAIKVNGLGFATEDNEHVGALNLRISVQT